jgi:hypothetical protein
MTEAVRERAKELKSKLIFISAGCTDELQPLDRKDFGPLKAKAKHQYRIGVRLGKEREKKQACQDMLNVWNELGEKVIKSAWVYLVPEIQAELADEEQRGIMRTMVKDGQGKEEVSLVFRSFFQ